MVVVVVVVVAAAAAGKEKVWWSMTRTTKKRARSDGEAMTRRRESEAVGYRKSTAFVFTRPARPPLPGSVWRQDGSGETRMRGGWVAPSPRLWVVVVVVVLPSLPPAPLRSSPPVRVNVGPPFPRPLRWYGGVVVVVGPHHASGGWR